MKRERIIYQEEYQKPGQRVLPQFWPKLPYLSNGFKVVDMHITKAGKIERDGKTYEFQDLRVLVAEEPVDGARLVKKEE